MHEPTPEKPETAAPEAAADLVRTVYEAADALRGEVAKIVVGQHQVIDRVIMCLFCRGHALLLGVPGLAKTLLVSTIADAMRLAFHRIQFTPDLMPSDITGTELIEEDRTTGKRNLRFVRGPVFANVLLTDEINRAPPKTQAALLEAMQEHQVTTAGRQHPLPQPFIVLATQNPIEQEGTYPLPEAQLDRFMFMIQVDYPGEEEEFQIVQQTTAGTEATLSRVLSAEQVVQIQQLVRDVPAADHVIRYALRLVRATRRPIRGEEDARPQFVRDYLNWGAGPRASQYLILAGKARAVLDGRTHVTVEDVRAVAHPVLRHRLITSFNADADGLSSDDLIDRLLEEVEVDGAADGRLDAVMH
jgi:MoxR-like ATPase